jgi:hypothetical protein
MRTAPSKQDYEWPLLAAKLPLAKLPLAGVSVPGGERKYQAGGLMSPFDPSARP